ncbi:MAG: DUF362 domain-containing protein [Deltaproteobacteria bacterium]|nr:DUF362 domain-containing protein [Deltaproteobacteria bacterium]
MQRIPGPFRVYVGLVPTGYLNPEAIDRVVAAGMSYCGASLALSKLRPGNRILVVPDVAMAEPKIARHAYTHPDVVRATLGEALRADPSGDATVLGRALAGFPSERVLKRATGDSDPFKQRGYFELENLFPGKVEVLASEDCDLYRYQLSKGPVLSDQDRRLLLASGILEADKRLLEGRLSNEIVTLREFHDSHVVVYCPKLKSSVLSQGFSGAVRLGGGLARGTFSDVFVADMLEVCNPQIVVSDGIIAAIGGNQVTQRGHELGVVLVSNNALAHDLVAAQILNLDPLRVNHLRIAIERGWGPSGLSQVEVGGDGLEAVRQLAQKTRFWDLGAISLERFAEKYERENPGLTFPLELISGQPYETSGSHGTLLDWLYLSYDFPRRRPALARWPRAAVCVGAVERYPRSHVVFAVGTRAIDSLARRTSFSTQLARFGRGTRAVRITRVQLKNGARHVVIAVPGSPPDFRKLVLAFALASAGKMLPRLLTPALVLDRAIATVRRWIEPARDVLSTRLVMTSRMPQNSWWSLKPTRLLPQPPARGASGVSAPKMPQQ